MLSAPPQGYHSSCQLLAACPDPGRCENNGARSFLYPTSTLQWATGSQDPASLAADQAPRHSQRCMQYSGVARKIAPGRRFLPAYWHAHSRSIWTVIVVRRSRARPWRPVYPATAPGSLFGLSKSEAKERPVTVKGVRRVACEHGLTTTYDNLSDCGALQESGRIRSAQGARHRLIRFWHAVRRGFRGHGTLSP